jgi:thymidine kinase
MDTLLFLPKVDADANKNKIHSRIGLIADAISVDTSFDFFDYVQNFKNEKKVDAILIDEVQFLTKDQVRQICKISDTLNIPSMCYGIRTDFRGELFEGSSELLALADNLIELKTVCDCGRKATMVVRLDESGKVITAGEKIQIGGNDTYKVYCRGFVYINPICIHHPFRKLPNPFSFFIFIKISPTNENIMALSFILYFVESNNISFSFCLVTV